jgi:hypothetical protein
MANPNIITAVYIYGKTALATPDTNNDVNVLANSDSSNKVLKINSIQVSNIRTDSTSADCTIAINSVADGSGTSHYLKFEKSIAGGESLVVVDRATAFYLEENRSIIVNSSEMNSLSFIIGYEEII